MSNVLPAGTRVVCPRKGHFIGVTAKPLMPGMKLMPSMIAFDVDQERVAGEECACRVCGSFYIKDNKIYTSEGWKPSEPKLEPVAHNKGK